MISAEPKPWMLLDTRNTVIFGDRALSNDPMEEVKSPYIRIFGLSYMSDRVPEKKLRIASGSIWNVRESAISPTPTLKTVFNSGRNGLYALITRESIVNEKHMM